MLARLTPWRCVVASGTYCSFLANEYRSQKTTLFNVSSSDMSVLNTVVLDGIAYNLHTNLADGSAYTILLRASDFSAVVVNVARDKVRSSKPAPLDEPPSSSFVVVVEMRVCCFVFVLVCDQVTPVIDISSYVNGVIHPGASTQCSDDGYMWVGIDSGGAGEDKLLTLRYASSTSQRDLA